jgi:molybdopterin-guanine dinucleotide biosynthesis protein A
MSGFQIFIKDKNLEICDTDELTAYFSSHARKQSPGNLPDLVAVCLCGGSSSRMGEPKFLITYHELPQFQQIQAYMEQLGIPCYLSCKTEQSNMFPGGTPLIYDQEKFANAGPMSGLLSAAMELEGKAILLIGCDYPLVQLPHLSMLANSYLAMAETCCYYNFYEQRPEGLLAVYHPNDIQQIGLEYTEGKQSLTDFLNQRSCLKIVPENAQILQSFNNPSDVKDFATLLIASQQKNPVF